MIYRYGNYGRVLLPQLQYILEYRSELMEMQLYHPHSGHQLAGALIASSKIYSDDKDWKHHAIAAARELLEEQPCPCIEKGRDILERKRNEDVYLQRELKRRECYMELSPAIGPIAAENPRANAYQGNVILSEAVKLIERGDYQGALAHLDLFTPFDRVNYRYSPVESSVQSRIELWKAKTYLLQGRFKTSFALSRKLLRECENLYRSNGSSILTHHIQVLCELGDTSDAEDCVDRAQAYFDKCLWTGVKKARALRCSKADVLLSKGSYCEAHDIYRELNSMSAPATNVTSFHYLAGLAMSSHLDNRLEEAYRYWDEVQKKLLEWRWLAGFSEMVFTYAISDLNFKDGRFEAGEELLRKGNHLFLKIDREYWVTWLGTKFLDFLKASISLRTSSTVEIC